MNLNTGGLVISDTDLNSSHNPKHDISSIQRRMLTQSEIESLQKNKKDSMQRMIEIFKGSNLMNKISEKRIA